MKTILSLDFILPGEVHTPIYNLVKTLFADKITKDITYRNKTMKIGDGLQIIFRSIDQLPMMFHALPPLNGVIVSEALQYSGKLSRELRDILRRNLELTGGKFFVL